MKLWSSTADGNYVNQLKLNSFRWAIFEFLVCVVRV